MQVIVLFRVATEEFSGLFRRLECFSGLDDLTLPTSLRLLVAFQSRVFGIDFIMFVLDEPV